MAIAWAVICTVYNWRYCFHNSLVNRLSEWLFSYALYQVIIWYTWPNPLTTAHYERYPPVPDGFAYDSIFFNKLWSGRWYSDNARDACRDRYLAVSFEVGGGENVPGIPGACATCNFAYLVRGPCDVTVIMLDLYCISQELNPRFTRLCALFYRYRLIISISLRVTSQTPGNRTPAPVPAK